jgi:hypothetical protein
MIFNKNGELLVNLKMGELASIYLSNAPFLLAAKILEGHIKADKNSCERLVNKINEDHWITSFWSETFGRAKPPAYSEWILPLITLDSARSAYNARVYSFAKSQLEKVFKQYKKVFIKWMEYRNKIVIGGEKAINVCNWTIIIFSAVATGGSGSWVTATGLKGLAIKGSISAGISGGTLTSRQVGGFVQMKDKIDIGKIVTEAGFSFVTSLIGGKLADKFKSLLTPKILNYLERNSKAFGKVLDIKYSSSGKPLLSYSFAQNLAADIIGNIGPAIVSEAVKKAITQAKGKSLTMEDFIKLVVEQISQQSISSIITVYIESKK